MVYYYLFLCHDRDVEWFSPGSESKIGICLKYGRSYNVIGPWDVFTLFEQHSFDVFIQV